MLKTTGNISLLEFRGKRPHTRPHHPVQTAVCESLCSRGMVCSLCNAAAAAAAHVLSHAPGFIGYKAGIEGCLKSALLVPYGNPKALCASFQSEKQ